METRERTVLDESLLDQDPRCQVCGTEEEPWDTRRCEEVATWRVVYPCGHDWLVCEGHRRSLSKRRSLACRDECPSALVSDLRFWPI